MKVKESAHLTGQSSVVMERRFLCGIKCFLFVINILAILVFVNLYTSNKYMDTLTRISSAFVNDTKKLMKLQEELALRNLATERELEREKAKARKLLLQPGLQNLNIAMERRVEGKSTYHTTVKPVTRRPRMCRGCFQHDYEYLIDNPKICKSNGQSIDVMILIFSTHSKRKQREALRQTWLTYSKNNTGNVRYAFMFGNIKSSIENRLLKEESDRYGDIVQENFEDSYGNLTVKTIMAFKWASTKCTQARFVMKADDDVYVNIPGVFAKIRNHGVMLQTRIGGVCKRKTKPDRNPKSKWYISYEMYPEKFIPEFCSGTAYLTSMNVARNIYKISSDIPYVNLEDIYISLCARELGYKFVDIFGFNAMRTPYKYCVFKRPTYVTAHSYTPNEMLEIWNTKC